MMMSIHLGVLMHDHTFMMENLLTYLLMSSHSYCQRIGRPDFWGGESELLVSALYDAHSTWILLF